MTFRAPYTIPAREEHGCTVVLLHGRGSSGEEFAEQLLEGRTSDQQSLLNFLPPSCKWVFPSARERYSTVFRMELTEWFDIASLDDPDWEFERQIEGLEESTGYVKRILQEAKTIPPDRIILGGISQGFATAALVLLGLSYPIGGFFGLLGWMPKSETAALTPTRIETPHTNLAGTPVFVSHSEDDSLVASRHGKAACTRLRDLGYQVRLALYLDGGQWLQEPLGYDDLGNFLKASSDIWRTEAIVERE